MDKDLLNITVTSFELLLPDLNGILSTMDKHNGSFPLQDDLLDKIPSDQIINWAYLYEEPLLAKGQLAQAISEGDNAFDISKGIQDVPDEEALSNVDSLNEALLEQIKIEKEQQQPFEPDNNDAMGADEFMTGLMLTLPLVFNAQAIMTHGCSMFTLVSKAKEGNDVAFYKAVQIDRTVLYGIPYFCNRLCKLQLSDNELLKGKLATSISGKIHSSRPDYPQVWFLFAVLEEAGLSKVPLKKLLEICLQLNIYGDKENQDEDTLKQLRQGYRKKRDALI